MQKEGHCVGVAPSFCSQSSKDTSNGKIMFIDSGSTSINRSRVKRKEPYVKLKYDFSDMVEELRMELALKWSEEETIEQNICTELEIASSSVKDIYRSFNLAVTQLNNNMTLIESDAKQLSNKLNVFCGMADNITTKVCALDTSKSRIVECMQRVSDLMDLRTCAEGVNAAMDQEDYELAAQHIQKFSALDSIVFRMGEQSEAKGTGQSMKVNYEVLREASVKLKAMIESKFDEAVKANDSASIQRFFKLFPLVGEHMNGITRFANYLCLEVRKFADNNYKVLLAGGTDEKRANVLYADSLTLLFEGIAREIQVYEPLIDLFYGPDKLLSLIEILQQTCDEESSKILTAFCKNRQFNAKATAVEKFTRNPDVQSGKINALELDLLLSEVTLMHTRTELYWRYLRRRLNAANRKMDEMVAETDADNKSEEKLKRSEEVARLKIYDRDQKLSNLSNRSVLGMKMQELLGLYILMEEYYMKESLTKAMALDQREPDSLTSSMLDDVFFIVRKCIRRSLSSSSVNCVCAMLNNGATVLDTQFFDYMFAAIKGGYPSVGWTAEAYQTAQAAYNAIQHGKTVAEAGPERQKEIFLTSLNNIRASATCIKTLSQGLVNDFDRNLGQISDMEKEKLTSGMGQFDDLIHKFNNAANIGIDKLCAAAFKPKLKASAELFMNVSHTPTESEFAHFDADDPFMNNFIATYDSQLAYFEPLLLHVNYQELFSATCTELSRQLERVLYRCSFNRLGGIQLDKEFRSMTSYLTAVGGWFVREKTTRLSQIVSLINVDSVQEAVEYYQQMQHGLKLGRDEVKKILSLRVDLSSTTICNLDFG